MHFMQFILIKTHAQILSQRNEAGSNRRCAYCTIKNRSTSVRSENVKSTSSTTGGRFTECRFAFVFKTRHFRMNYAIIVIIIIIIINILISILYYNNMLY